MLKISNLADYAVALVGQMERGRPMSASALARNSRVSLPAASKTLKILAKAGVLSSRKGKAGGYALSANRSEATLLEIVEAVDGVMALTPCSKLAGLCAREGFCSASGALRQANGEIVKALSGIKIKTKDSREARS